MVSFHIIDVPTQHQTPSPSVIQALSPSAPPPLPSPLINATSDFFSSQPSSSSSSSVSFDIDAPTFGCLLIATLGACLISGLTFQWLIEKGLFRKSLLEKTNQYNVIVGVASMAALLQTLCCFLNVLLGAPYVLLSFFILLTWILMTHGSVMIVARKVSLTYNNAEQAWQRLLYLNAVMMVVSLLVCVVWIGSNHTNGSDDIRDKFESIAYILDPTQMALWGLLELVLSGMFIIQMRKYYWQAVERRGILTLLIVALCDIGLIVANLYVGDLLIIGGLRGFVYTLRIRLELEVLSAMVTYIQNKRKEVVYMAQEQRKKRRSAKRRTSTKGGGGSSNGDLDNNDEESNGSNRSSGSLFALRRRRNRRRSRSGSGFAELDDNDSYNSYQSLFNMLRRRRGRKNDNDDDSTCSHMSVFQRLPHATDFSNIFQRNFLEDFAAATQNSGSFISTSLQNLGKKCRDLANKATDLSVASAARSGGSSNNQKSKDKKKRYMGSSTLRTQVTVRNSTSSCEIPIQGMEIKLAPASEMTVPELGEDSLGMQQSDLEAGGHYRRSSAVSSSFHVSDRDESEQQVLPFHYGCASVSDIGLSCSSSDDDDDDSSDSDDSNSDDSSEDTPQLQGSWNQQPDIPVIPLRQQSQQSSDNDDEEQDDDEDEPTMFGIPRRSFVIKDPSDLQLQIADLDEDDVDSEEEEDDVPPAPFGIPRESDKTNAPLPPTPTPAAARNQGGELPLPAFRRCVSLSKHALPALRRSSSARGLRESGLERMARQDQLRRSSKIDNEELLRALDQLESMDCL